MRITITLITSTAMKAESNKSETIFDVLNNIEKTIVFYFCTHTISDTINFKKSIILSQQTVTFNIYFEVDNSVDIDKVIAELKSAIDDILDTSTLAYQHVIEL